MSTLAERLGPADRLRSNLSSLALAGPLAVLLGAAAIRSMQLAVTLALLVLLLGVRLQSRTWGLALLWSYWLLAPFLRRLLELAVEAPGADPLSLLPFLGTALLAMLELHENQLDRRARAILGMAGIGFAIGIPAGFAADPAAGSFAAFAYLAALSAFVLGWGDGIRSGGGLTLYRVLAVAVVPLSVYAVVQYFAPLASWDANWVATAPINSIGAPQEDHIRVFATLNSPFTFAIVLATAILLGLASRRRMSGVVLAAVLVALALTYVRSAWLALAFGIVVFVFAARGRAAGRIVAVVAVCLVGLAVVGHGNPTTRAFTERLTSLGNPSEDRSAKERLETTTRLLPQSIQEPVGHGLGQAGLAVRLEEGGNEGVETVDDGYLSLIYQVGPFGFVLVVAALVTALAAAVQAIGRPWGPSRQAAAALFATLAMLLVALSSADAFFGVSGAILWYCCGAAVAAASRERRARPERPINE
jgi:putative inorganic carbon (HCO3(-)) transporter